MSPRTAVRLAAGRAICRFVVAGALFGTAALIYRAVSGRSGQPPLLGVVAVTVVVALTLWLLQRRIEAVTARLLLGERADGYQVMQALTRQLAAVLPVDEVAPRVAETAVRTTGRARAEVRLWLADGQQWTRSWPPAPVSGEAPIGPVDAVGVQHSGLAVGEIVVGELAHGKLAGGESLTGHQGADDGHRSDLSPRNRKLLDELARPAGAALSTVRLTVELRNRKADLERTTAALRASRERLLGARALEQRRMRAEVASLVRPHLAAALAATADPGSLDTAATAAGLALDELRSIARGIYPPTLSDVGLAGSLQSWLGRTDLDAVLEVPADLPVLHARPELEACLYFCAVTSIAGLAGRVAGPATVRIDDLPDPVLQLTARAPEAVARDIVEAVTDRIEAFGGTVAGELATDHFAFTATVPARSAILS